MTASREALHHLVDELPDNEIGTADRFLRYLRDVGSDPVKTALAAAPDDDEEESAEEVEAVRQALDEVARGDVLTTEQLRRELDL